uniref:Uncharacterized protein n=1 Tax=Lates calcarifer TaxID=8187 RepID=A0A4W6G680_LATCA
LTSLKNEYALRKYNIKNYLFLMVFKLGLDAAIFYLCCWKLRTSFLNMCSLSIILADLVMVSCTAAVWFLGGERSPVSSCFILAHSSAIFGALPLPMICLGLFDYCIEDTCIGNKSALCKFLRNVVLTLLVWTQAVIYSFVSVKAEVTVLDYARGIKAAVCVVEESSLIIYFILGLFTTVIFTKNSKERYPEETIESRPPLWFSLTLGFTIFWMPYLAVSVACLVFGYGVPAYITVNLLWLECTNSLLVGVVFWIKGRSLGPYSHLPENVCLWRIYWYLSKGTQQQQLPVAVFNPSKDKRNTLLYV